VSDDERSEMELTSRRSDATTTEYAFDVDTQVEATAPGVFAATVTDRWNALTGSPNGGYLLAIVLRTLSAVMPHPDPIVVSAFYLRPGAAGPAEVRTEIARSGRRVATGEASLFQDGKEAVRLVATFGDLSKADGRTLLLNQPPDLPPADQCVDPLASGPIPGLTIVDRFDYRMPEQPGWAQGSPTGRPSMELWMRFSDGREPDLLALPLLVDAAAPAVLEIGETGSATIELTVHLRARPAPGWLACRMSTRHVIGGYHEEDFEIWDSKGNLVAQSRQLALLI
jgi:acyl-CoA thioesterase